VSNLRDETGTRVQVACPWSHTPVGRVTKLRLNQTGKLTARMESGGKTGRRKGRGTGEENGCLIVLGHSRLLGWRV
jgi:hypothetical protein